MRADETARQTSRRPLDTCTSVKVRSVRRGSISTVTLMGSVLTGRMLRRSMARGTRVCWVSDHGDIDDVVETSAMLRTWLFGPVIATTAGSAVTLSRR